MNIKVITKILAAAIAASLMFALCACSGGGSKAPAASSYKDGTYTGKSEEHAADEDGNGSGYGEVTIEIKDNKIVSCEFSMYELDGTIKDETYGADLSQENRRKAQKAVQSADKYAAMLTEAGNLDGVDVISGATISFEEFKEAVNDALSQAAGE